MTNESVGTRLKLERERQSLSLRNVEQATNIRVSFLERIEADDGSLPNDPYTKGFIHSYGHFLGLDGFRLAKEFNFNEGNELTEAAARLRPISAPRVIVTPQLFLTLLIAGTLVAVAGYIVYQLSFLATPPNLSIYDPPGDKEIYTSTITVAGKATAGSDVFINDTLIATGDDGAFKSDVAIQPGVNSIRVSAKNRLGKSSEVTRSIIGKIAGTSEIELPGIPIDGVAIKVIASKTINVIAVVDGTNVFNGAMLPGSSRTFRGTEKIEIDTTNAAATSLIITNKNTAAKQFGQVGTADTAKQNLEFTKDTQFAN